MLLSLLLLIPAPSESVRLPVTRDTWFSNVGEEAAGNNGGAPRLKLKGHQEMSLVDFDPAPLRGREVRKLTLHLKLAGPERLLRVTVASFRAEWVEGTSSGYQPQIGASSFRHRKHPDTPWDATDMDLTAVTLGHGGSVWGMADASGPDADGWQTVEVSPAVLADRLAGLSHGFLLYDDVGSEWTRDGEKWANVHMPNRFVFSRDSNRASAPYFTAELGGPAPPATTTPARPIPVPAPVAPAAIPATATPERAAGPLPRLGRAEVAVIDELDKVSPETGRAIPTLPGGYLEANHLWSAKAGRVNLTAARNETVGFQVWVRGAITNLTPSVENKVAGITTSVSRYRLVDTPAGRLPDPLVPVIRPISVNRSEGGVCLHVEVHAGHAVESGNHTLSLTLGANGDDRLTLPIDLAVLPVTLPDHLSFIPEMNTYGLPDDDFSYYRLAHHFRTVLNVVPYNQRGEVAAGWAPTQAPDGKWDWSAWDAKFGPLFDGSAFAGLPRAGTPTEAFYLPIHENWPALMKDHYNGDYWADRAFTPAYREAIVNASAEFSRHLSERGWRDTRFQLFLNNKKDFKEKGWSRGSSPWLLDEPAGFQDFWALKWYATAIREGVNRAKGDARMLFRADISRPQWQRDSLDGLLDYNVVSGVMRTYHALVMDRKRRDSQIVLEYGTANAVEQSNVQPAAWCADAWTLGADGVVPWQTVSNGDAWRTGSETAVLYVPLTGTTDGPAPSARLVSFRRGQQLAEYLTLASLQPGMSRESVAAWARGRLELRPTRQATAYAGAEDAGRLDYGRLSAAKLEAARHDLGAFLAERRPAAARRAVELGATRK